MPILRQVYRDSTTCFNESKVYRMTRWIDEAFGIQMMSDSERNPPNKTPKRIDDSPKELENGKLLYQTGLDCLRDWSNGTMSTALDGQAGMLWRVRLPDGSIATSFVWEHHERCHANLVVFAAGDTVIVEAREKLGPYPTRGHAGKWAGKIAGDIEKNHKDRDFNEDAEKGGAEK